MLHRSLRFAGLRSIVARRLLLSLVALMAGCSSWRTTPLEPQRFNSNSPRVARLTFRNGTQVRVHYPAVRGDSLAWFTSNGGDSVRAVPLDSVLRVEVPRTSWDRDVGWLAILAIAAVLFSYAAFSQIGGP